RLRLRPRRRRRDPAGARSRRHDRGAGVHAGLAALRRAGAAPAALVILLSAARQQRRRAAETPENPGGNAGMAGAPCNRRVECLSYVHRTWLRTSICAFALTNFLSISTRRPPGTVPGGHIHLFRIERNDHGYRNG